MKRWFRRREPDTEIRLEINEGSFAKDFQAGLISINALRDYYRKRVFVAVLTGGIEGQVRVMPQVLGVYSTRAFAEARCYRKLIELGEYSFTFVTEVVELYLDGADDEEVYKGEPPSDRPSD